MRRPFEQVDVFAERALRGNPLAVVAEAAELDPAEMQRLARWTNLSETVFLLPPSDPQADYRLRIFTPLQELPFAGHPTLGAAHVWLGRGGKPRQAHGIVQECGAGLIALRRDDGRLFFRAPPLLRDGPLDPSEEDRIVAALGLDAGDVMAAAWADNGPGWAALHLRDHARMMAVRPDFAALAGTRVGLVAATGADAPRFELRAFTATGGEDPVTGSLQAGVAQWLRARGAADGAWIAAQGSALGREGRVHVRCDGPDIWIGGRVETVISGDIAI